MTLAGYKQQRKKQTAKEAVSAFRTQNENTAYSG